MRASTLRACLLMLLFSVGIGQPASAQFGQKWITSWAASVQGPYPSGSAVAQPDLEFVFPTPSANDQTFRLIVHPDLWSRWTRIRFSNVWGTQPVTFDAAFVGLQKIGAVLQDGTNQPITFNGSRQLTVQPGQSVWSDPVQLPFVPATPSGVERKFFEGRKLAVSFHVVGQSGPMTWHAKAMTTNYVSNPGSGSFGKQEDDKNLPNSTTSWYFIDALDMLAPAETQLVVALGDSITDGTSSTINGDDRWPDVLARRMHEKYGPYVVVVNEGIGGNQIVGPATYTPATPASGGPAAVQRVGRDVLSLSGVTAVIFLDGTNDVSAGTAVSAIEAGIQNVVAQLRAAIPHIRIVAGTITSELGAAGFGGTPAAAAERLTLNAYIESSGLFNGVVDFYTVTTDPTTGQMMPQFVPNTSTGPNPATGAVGDYIHPNRAGYLAMGYAIKLSELVRPF